MELNNHQLEALSQALLDALTTPELGRMLKYRLNKSLSGIAGPGNDEQVVFELVTAANRQGWIGDLIVAARDTVPRNAKLLAFAQDFGGASANVSRQELERIVNETNAFLVPDQFRERMGEQEPRVARVEITVPQGMIAGTGFLLGPDVLITNHHVVASLLGATGALKAGSPKNVLVRFDYKRLRAPDGSRVGESVGRTCAFADDWVIDFSPLGSLGASKPGELDYCLIRLEERVGDDKLDRGALATPERRGFVSIPAKAPSLATDATVFILQHPRGRPLELALETKSVLGVFEDGRRVRYTTNTEGGSSGSPCFSPAWELAALHHSGDPDFDPAHKPEYNEGIPFTAIVELLKERGKLGALGAGNSPA